MSQAKKKVEPDPTLCFDGFKQKTKEQGEDHDSTRKMNQLFNDLNISGIDRSFVSRCAKQIDAEVEVWKNRALDTRYAYIWLDAIYTKIRTERGVVSTAVLIAIGLREDGHRDVLGLHLGNKESYYNWKDFLQHLKARGLERSELWISDEHDSRIKSIEECFPGQQRQRCIIHWMRNAQSKVSKTDLLWLLPLLKDLVGSRTRDSFELAWKELINTAQAKAKDKLLDWLDSTFHEISVYLEFPPSHWCKIKSTNPLERLNEELRRREKCIRYSPMRKVVYVCSGLSYKDTQRIGQAENYICQNHWIGSEITGRNPRHWSRRATGWSPA